MCGRFVFEADEKQIAQAFAVKLFNNVSTKARYNVAPTTPVCIVLNDKDNTREARTMRWGLIPSWVKDLSQFKATTFNARDDRIEESRVFSPAFKKRRCIIPISGYYEWKKISASKKQPYYFKAKNGSMLALAGVWDKATLSDGTVIESCSIITTYPNEVTEEYHDRMPVILSPSDYDKWLSLDTTAEELKAMLKPCHPDLLEIYAVDKGIGSVKNDFATNIVPLSKEETLF